MTRLQFDTVSESVCCQFTFLSISLILGGALPLLMQFLMARSAGVPGRVSEYSVLTAGLNRAVNGRVIGNYPNRGKVGV